MLTSQSCTAHKEHLKDIARDTQNTRAAQPKAPRSYTLLLANLWRRFAPQSISRGQTTSATPTPKRLA